MPFPRTTVAGLSLSRLIIGTNYILGYSHKSVAWDNHIKAMNSSVESIASIIEAFLQHDVDTIMATISVCQNVIDAIKTAEDRTGKRVYRVDTPAINVDNTREARQEAMASFKKCAEAGADFCLIHHSSCEQLVNRNTRTIDRLPDYTSMMRECGLIPGLSAHMPEIVMFSDLNEYDVETYIQIYNSIGYLMQVEVETVHSVIQNAKKPVMTIKSMAAGRQTPFVGLNFVWNTIRPCDMVTIGCLTPDEVHVDVEISLAAIERRPPNVAGRGTINNTFKDIS